MRFTGPNRAATKLFYMRRSELEPELIRCLRSHTLTRIGRGGGGNGFDKSVRAAGEMNCAHSG
jgi:hypothetical protein